jgi:hypothetical protein
MVLVGVEGVSAAAADGASADLNERSGACVAFVGGVSCSFTSLARDSLTGSAGSRAGSSAFSSFGAGVNSIGVSSFAVESVPVALPPDGGEAAVGGPSNLSAAQKGLDLRLGEAVGELLTTSLDSRFLSTLGPNGDCDVFRGEPGRDRGFVRSISAG